MRTFGVGAVLVTIFVPDGRNGTLCSYAYVRPIASFLHVMLPRIHAIIFNIQHLKVND
jgi:hypothetical protein